MLDEKEDLFNSLCGKYDLLLYVNTFFIGNGLNKKPSATDP